MHELHSKKQVFFIHGGNAYSNYEDFLADLRTMPLRDLPGNPPMERWDSCLEAELGSGYELFKPSMPNSKNAHYCEWKIWFERYCEYMRDGALLVGWSLGGYFLVKYLIEETLSFRPKALVLMASPYMNDTFGHEDGGDFAFDTKRLGELATKVDSIFILHSSDDQIVPVAHAQQYSKALPDAHLLVFSDKNHFLVSQFPEFVNLIKKL